MKRDPLAVLSRLRGAEVMLARRHMAEEAEAHQHALAREAAAEAALQVEAMQGGLAYAAWLPRGLAARDEALATAQRTEAGLATAATELGRARMAERAVQAVAALRESEHRRQVQRAEQRALDEAGARGKAGAGR